MKAQDVIRVSPGLMRELFSRILTAHGFSDSRAGQCAQIFTDNSVDGVYSHGVNRFPRFVEYIVRGFIQPDADPVLKRSAGNIEQWDGHFGAGPVNAVFATERAMELARNGGIGCATLCNNNHWLRAGTYGWLAARKGFALIAFTNTIANMPAWGAVDARLGNNPFVIALPYGDEAVVLDMAMSQYSFGALEMAQLKGEKLPVIGGYDPDGNPTNDPGLVLQSRRPVPIGYWKGSGFSIVLDMLASVLSGGMSTSEISQGEAEFSSQVFIAIDTGRWASAAVVEGVLKKIIDDVHGSIPEQQGRSILYPGERVLETRHRNLQEGIPVVRKIWDRVLQLNK